MNQIWKTLSNTHKRFNSLNHIQNKKVQFSWVIFENKKFSRFNSLEKKIHSHYFRKQKIRFFLSQISDKKKIQFFLNHISRNKIQFFWVIFQKKRVQIFESYFFLKRLNKGSIFLSHMVIKKVQFFWVIFVQSFNYLSHFEKSILKEKNCLNFVRKKKIFESYKKVNSLSLIEEKEGSILCVTYSRRKVQFFASYSRRKVQFYEPFFSWRFNSLSHVFLKGQFFESYLKKRKSSILWVILAKKGSILCVKFKKGSILWFV